MQTVSMFGIVFHLPARAIVGSLASAVVYIFGHAQELYGAD